MKQVQIYMGVLFIVFAASSAFAAEKEYKMRVDGLACPYCAYGIEKKFKKMEGVKYIDVNLKKGIVSVCASDNVKFSDNQLTQIFNDSGFTYNNMEQAEKCQTQ